MLHAYNLLSALLLQEEDHSGRLDPCEWYFATFVFDICFITLTSWLLLRTTLWFFSRHCRALAFRTGDYYEPMNFSERDSTLS